MKTNLQELINKYNQITEKEISNSEIYKWEAIQHFQENWKKDCPFDKFFGMFKEAFKKKENLIFQNSYGFLSKLAEYMPKEAKEHLVYLFQDEIPLEERIPVYQERSNQLLQELKTKLGKDNINHQQDERTISFLLTLHNPEKYFLYKDNVYRWLCDSKGVQAREAGKKYFHFVELAQEDLEVIRKDDSIQELVNSFIPSGFKFDSTNLIFQDIYYRTMPRTKQMRKEFFIYLTNEVKNTLEEENHPLGKHIWREPQEAFRWISIWKTEDIDPYFLHYEIILYKNEISIELHPEGSPQFKIAFDRFMEQIDLAKYSTRIWHYGNENDKKGNTHKIISRTKCCVYDNESEPTFEQINSVSEKLKEFYEDFQQKIENYLFDLKFEFNFISKNYTMKTPLNQILYGPPGTGKTYSTIDVVNEILAPENKLTRKEKKDIFDELVANKRAYFTTFHQSMSYEEFIEGIKPITIKEQVHYKITDGIFKSICEQCLDEIKELKSQNDTKIEANLSFREKFNEFVIAIQKGIVILKTRSGIEVNLSKISAAGNMRLITGTETRDYIISMNRLEKLVQAFPNPKKIVNIHEEIRDVIGGSHSSLYYAALEAFVEFEKDIQNSVNVEGKELELKDIKLTNEEINNLPHYFLIIDEINRGNVSSIFGELITLIEQDKRFGKENQMFIKLPYSKEDFIVPPNLYIIGTMNTADRSVEALDTALRRRFSFTEMLPQPDLLSPSAMLIRLMWQYEYEDWKDKEYLEKENQLRNFFGQTDDIEWETRKTIWYNLMKGKDASIMTHFEKFNFNGYNLQVLLETINKRIEVLVDRDHTIGHAYLIDVNSEETLKFAFKNKIIPLLQEYFYGNYEKMEMVIGSAFFEDLEDDKVTFAKGNYNQDEIPKRYKLKTIDKEFDIKHAIDLLLNNVNS